MIQGNLCNPLQPALGPLGSLGASKPRPRGQERRLRGPDPELAASARASKPRSHLTLAGHLDKAALRCERGTFGARPGRRLEEPRPSLKV